MLFRTLRKLTDPKLVRRLPSLKEVRPVDIQLNIFGELFDAFPEDVTNFDVKRYNKFLNDNQTDPAVAKRKPLEVRQAHFEVTNETGWQIKHLSTDVALAKDIRGSRKWDFIETASHGVLLVKKQKDRDTKIVNCTQFAYWASETKTAINWTINEKIMLVALAAEARSLATVDNCFVLRFMDISGTLQAEYLIPVSTRDARKASAISISPNGERSAVAIADQLFVYDVAEGLIATLRIPIKEGWEVSPFEPPSSDYQKALDILGIASSLDRIELRNVYRSKLRELHPDLNPDDPKANEKTIELIAAYEKLAEESSEDILLEGTEEYATYRTVTSDSSSRITAFMTGDGIDWVGTILINDDSTFIYATETGNCVKVNTRGKAEFKANLGAHINEVVIASGCLYAIYTAYDKPTPNGFSLDPKSIVVNITENRCYVVGCAGDVVFSDQFLAVSNDRTISIFGIDGSIGPTVKCLQPVRFIASTRAGLIIDSGPSQYIFEVARE